MISHHGEDSEESEAEHLRQVPAVVVHPEGSRSIQRKKKALEKVNSGESILSNGAHRYHFGSFYLRMGAVGKVNGCI